MGAVPARDVPVRAGGVHPADLLTGIMVFIFPNTAAQIAVTFVVEFFFFVVSVVLLPYRKRCVRVRVCACVR